MGLGTVAKAGVEIRAEWEQYRRDLEGVKRETSRAADAMNKSMLAVRRGVLALSGAAAAAGASYLALAQQAMAYSANLVDAAERTNANVERLQELRFAAEQTGATAQLMDEALRRLTRRMSLFAQDGGGPAAKAIETLGITVTDAEGNLRQSSDVFDEIVRKLETMEDQATATALASQFFGENAGPVLMPMLRSGTLGIQQLTDRARELGVVLDEAAVRKAADAKTQLDQLSQSIRMQLMSAVLDNMDALESMAKTMEEVVIPAMRALIKWAGDAADAIRWAVEAAQFARDFLGGASDETAAAAGASVAESSGPGAWVSGPGVRPDPTDTTTPDEGSGAFDYLYNQEQGPVPLPAIGVTLPPPPRPRPRPAGIVAETTGGGGGGRASGGGGGASAISELEREAEIRQRLLEYGEMQLERLQLEIDTRGLSAAEIAKETYRREALAAAKRQGLDLDQVSIETGQTLRQEIEAQAEAIGALTEALDDGSTWGDEFSRTLQTIATNATSLEDAAKRAALAIAEMALQAAIFGSGPLGGALGGGLLPNAFPALFNAKGNAFHRGSVIPFAKGGVVQGAHAFPMRSGVGVMGEAGPEAILPLERGPDGSLGVRAGAGVQQVEVVVSVDDEGSIRAYVRDQIGAAIDGYDRGLADRVADIREDPAYRG